ncbi:MAG: hypothetical protein EXR72_06945 [Myxococcales bacterium]|nr:hypothetical protein [Myxococcales bacterium]
MRPGPAVTALLALVSSCGSDGIPASSDGSRASPDGAAIDLATPDLAPRIVDRDGDGLDDAGELAHAAAYLPYLSLSPRDGCDTMGLLVRVRPHPADPSLLHILYDQLYDRDCGLGGHPGDDEVFALTVDPARAPPSGIVAMKAISHQGTACERVSACGRCPGQTPCATLTKGGVPWPAVWPSRGKHGTYVNRAATCTLAGTCFDTCEDNPAPRAPPLVNAGEPGHPLVHDLTSEGFITDTNGWKSAALFHFDPWGPEKFGGAGVVANDLVDPAFDTPACR